MDTEGSSSDSTGKKAYDVPSRGTKRVASCPFPPTEINIAPDSVFAKTFYDQTKTSRQQCLKRNNRNPIHPNIDVIPESPSFLLAPQRESAVLDLVELNKRLKELGVHFGVPEVATERGSELHETVQTTSSDHIKQFFRGELG